jgi:hypothetical protein
MPTSATDVPNRGIWLTRCFNAIFFASGAGLANSGGDDFYHIAGSFCRDRQICARARAGAARPDSGQKKTPGGEPPGAIFSNCSARFSGTG